MKPPDSLTPAEIREIERELQVVDTQCGDDPDIRAFVNVFRAVSAADS